MLNDGGYMLIAMLVAVAFLKVVFDRIMSKANREVGFGRYLVTCHPKRLINKSEETLFNSINQLVAKKSIWRLCFYTS